MAIKKQEFYEGAALYSLLRSGNQHHIFYSPPFFFIDNICIYFKYSTAVRSPWAFSFSAEEQNILFDASKHNEITIGLICGGDGVAAIPFEIYASLANHSSSTIHISCSRRFREYYEVRGPCQNSGVKIAPSSWNRSLNGKK